MAFVNNYSTSFRWLDYFFGTDDKYRAYKKRTAAAKAELKKKNASEAEMKAMEEKMAAEAEREGLMAEAEVENYDKKKRA
jgi:methylsterol monooxygenase